MNWSMQIPSTWYDSFGMIRTSTDGQETQRDEIAVESKKALVK